MYVLVVGGYDMHDKRCSTNHVKRTFLVGKSIDNTSQSVTLFDKYLHPDSTRGSLTPIFVQGQVLPLQTSGKCVRERNHLSLQA